MKGFMKIAPYYNNSIGGKFTSELTAFKGKTITKDILNSNSFKNAVANLSFYVNVTNMDVDFNVETKSYQLHSPSSTEKVGFSHHHSGNGGITIKADCITVERTDNKKIDLNWLYSFFLNERPVNVIVNSKSVANGIYDISSFGGFKLVRPNVYEFSIELKTYTNTKAKLTNKVTVLQSNLKRCSKPKHKVLSKQQIKKGEYTVKKGKKKTKVKIKKSTCIKYLNQVLKIKGCYPSNKGKYTTYKQYNSYFTKATVTGLKRYGKKWNKKGLKPKLNTKGKLTKEMWAAIKRYPEL